MIKERLHKISDDAWTAVIANKVISEIKQDIFFGLMLAYTEESKFYNFKHPTTLGFDLDFYIHPTEYDEDIDYTVECTILIPGNEKILLKDYARPGLWGAIDFATFSEKFTNSIFWELEKLETVKKENKKK